MAVLLSIGLVACGSGASGFGPPPGGGSGTTATTQVTVVDTVTDPHPLAHVQVSADGDPVPMRTGPDGRATVTVPTGHASRLVLQLPVGSQYLYPLLIPAGQPTVEVTLFADPIAATTTTPGVTIMPTTHAPAGIAGIIDPPDGATIPCPPPPAVCLFDVHGQASPLLGHPDTPFFVYVAVTPLAPPGAGTVLHVPPARVDPVTGLWQAAAYLGGTGDAVAQSGERFQLVALVTSALLTTETRSAAVPFPRPQDVPGVVYISRVLTLQVGARHAQAEAAVLLEPPDSECLHGPVTFQWRIEQRRPDVTYCADLLIAPDHAPFDSPAAQRFPAGQATALPLTIEPESAALALVQWGIRVRACTTVGASCAERDPPCQGHEVLSDVRRVYPRAPAPHCP
jgi:hypothetical protein